MVKINLGSGHDYREGYLNLDLDPNVRSDLTADARDLRMFHDESVEEVNAEHLIEHFSYQDFEKALREWKRILKHGGKLIIECPDLEALCKAFIEGDYEQRWISWPYKGDGWWSIRTHLYGKQDRPLQFHLSGYDKWSLEVKLRSEGFRDIAFTEPRYKYCPCIRVEAVKP